MPRENHIYMMNCKIFTFRYPELVVVAHLISIEKEPKKETLDQGNFYGIRGAGFICRSRQYCVP